MAQGPSPTYHLFLYSPLAKYGFYVAEKKFFLYFLSCDVNKNADFHIHQ